MENTFTTPRLNRRPCFLANHTMALIFMRVSSVYILLLTAAIFTMAGPNTKGQGVENTTVHLEFLNRPLMEVFLEIEKQTEFQFHTKPETVNKFQNISLPKGTYTVKEVLDHVLDGTGLKFQETKNYILIFLLEEKFPGIEEAKTESKTSVPAEEKEQAGGNEEALALITGTVKDAATQEPLAGVNIIVKGTTRGTTTDAEGRFAIDAANENETLVFSFIGYTTQEIAVNGRSVIDVALVEDVQSLEEVVVVGFGTQKKVNLTGAVSSVTAEELVTATVADISNNLTGKLPGLRVQTLSSEPGVYDNNIDIRGWGTMLVIVNGIPRDNFQRLDPSTVESITILKDASAAVYGVKAANGVMLITTKGGVAGESSIKLNSSYGIEWMTEYPRSIDNSIDNLILKNEAALRAGNPLPYPNYKLYTGDDPLYPSNDWWNLTLKDLIPMNKNDLSFAGGNERSTYFVSVGNLSQAGIYKTDVLNYNRYNLSADMSANIVKGLTAEVIINGMIDFREAQLENPRTLTKNIWMQPPYEPIYANNTAPYYYDGEADMNPIAVLDKNLTGYRRYQTKMLQSNLSLTYDVPFIKGLKVKGLYAYDVNYGLIKLWRKKYNEYKYNADNGQYIPTARSVPSRLQQSFDETIYEQTQLSLEYKNTFGDHEVTGLLLRDTRDGAGTSFMAQKFFAMATMDQLDAGLTADAVATGSEKVINSNIGLIGRVNYIYKMKYLSEFSFRYDGSSLFPKESRWGFFPAVSLGWRINEESFIKDNFSFINNLKLRISHGVMGDDSGASGFQYIPGFTYPSGSSMFDGATLTLGSVSKGLANPNITWYTATISNIGLDATLWNGLLDFTVEGFRRTREGLLGTRVTTLPAEFGASFPQENLNSDFSRGFELVVGHANRINDFSYSIRGNMSYTQQKWKHIESAPAGNSYLNWRNYYENRNKNIMWGYGTIGGTKQYPGVYLTQEELNTSPSLSANGPSGWYPGDVHYEDWNQDGQISTLDYHPIGRGLIPEIYFGLALSVEWKGLSLTALLQGASNYTQMAQEQLMGPLPWGRNSLQIFLDRWHHEDPLDFSTPWVPGKYPLSAEGFGSPNNNPEANPSTYWVHDVSYLRLKSVELSYSLPEAWLGEIKTKQVRVFINAFNILTLKPKDVQFDPEKQIGGNAFGERNADHGYKYPIMATSNFGISITF